MGAGASSGLGEHQAPVASASVEELRAALATAPEEARKKLNDALLAVVAKEKEEETKTEETAPAAPVGLSLMGAPRRSGPAADELA